MSHKDIWYQFVYIHISQRNAKEIFRDGNKTEMINFQVQLSQSYAFYVQLKLNNGTFMN